MKNLKTIRQNKAISQAQVASALAIPPTTYATYEQNKATPSENMIVKIADYFGCSVDYLLGHETQGIVHLDSFTPNQKKAISMLRQLTDDETLILLGYLARMTGTPLESLTEESKANKQINEGEI